MPVIVDCTTCNRKLRIPDDLLGQLVKCPTCGHTFRSAGNDASTEPVSPPPTLPPQPAVLPKPASPQKATDAEMSVTIPPMPLGLGDPEEDDESGEPRSPRIPIPRVPSLDTLDHSKRPGGGFGFVEVSQGKADPPLPGRQPPAIPARSENGRRDFDRDLPSSRSRRFWDEPLQRMDAEPHRGGLVLFLGIIGLVLGCTMLLIPVAWIPGLVAWILGQGDLARMKRGEIETDGYGATQAGWICGIIATILWGLPTLGLLGLLLLSLMNS
jgi:hypothetical protein